MNAITAAIRRWLARASHDRRWISDSRERETHAQLVRERLDREQGRGDVVFEGGPRDGETDTVDHCPAVIGDGKEGGVYQRTDEQRDGLLVYRWQVLTDAEAAALLEADLRANQEAEQ